VTDPSTATELLTAASGLVSDLGLNIVFIAAAIVGLGAYVLRRFKAAAK